MNAVIAYYAYGAQLVQKIITLPSPNLNSVLKGSAIVVSDGEVAWTFTAEVAWIFTGGVVCGVVAVLLLCLVGLAVRKLKAKSAYREWYHE